jgi:hypothetical protein
VHPDAPSRRASGHSVSRRDYSSPGLHQLYCTYAVHPDAPSQRSTSCQSVALALAVCPVNLLCVVTTHLATATDILRLRRAFGCLGTSRGSSSTTLPTPRVRVPRHLARLVTPLVDYSVCRDFILRPHWLYFSYAVRHDYLSRGNTGSTLSTSRAVATSSSSRIASTVHLD